MGQGHIQLAQTLREEAKKMEDFREKQKLHRKKVRRHGSRCLCRRVLILRQQWAAPGWCLPPCPSPPPWPRCLLLPGNPELLPTCCNHAGELCGSLQLPSSRCHVFSFGQLLGPAIAGAQLQGCQPQPGVFLKRIYSAV